MIESIRPRAVLMLTASLALWGGALLASAGYGGEQATPAPRIATPELPSLLFPEAELPGRYYMGDGLNVNCALVLDAEHRFKFSSRGGLGEYDRNEGSWRLVGDVVEVIPERPNRRTPVLGVNLRFVPVKWGARLYLVDENETPGFAAAAGFGQLPGGEGVHGPDFVKTSVLPLPPRRGKPLLPERFRGFYQLGPVAAKVVKLEPNGRVRIKSTRPSGLRVGLLLGADSFAAMELKVVEVAERDALAEVFYFPNSGVPVKVGQEFTTGSFLKRPLGTGFERRRQLPPPAPRG